MSKSKEMQRPPVDLLPELRAVIEAAGVDPSKLALAVYTNDAGQLRFQDKHSLVIDDGTKAGTWNVGSLAGLFRGDRQPPADIEHYPEEYIPYFYFIESHLLTLCDAVTPPTDQELEEIYAALRRRPDGRSISATHDAVWQIVALLLGHYVISEAEYEGILSALIRSARRWSVRPVSRFYTDYLRRTFAGR